MVLSQLCKKGEKENSVSCKGAENIHFIFISFVDVHIKQPGEFKRFLFFCPSKTFLGSFFKNRILLQTFHYVDR